VAEAPGFGQAWGGGTTLDEDRRKQVVTHLEELRTRVETLPAGDPRSDQPLLADLDTVRSLVTEPEADPKQAHAAAFGLEQRLLAWEAEHPELVALATRVVRALEDAGL
jgi:hypothetical protein